MRKVKKVITTLLLLICAYVSGQKNHQELDRHIEFGIMGGVFNYTGDISPTYRFQFHRPGGFIFYRHNFTNLTSVLRFNLGFGSITADESVFDFPTQQQRQFSFSNNLIEFSALYEYNFFNFRDYDGIFYMSPYLFGGLGLVTSIGQESTAVIPFGVGVKFRVAKFYNLGIEFGARKSFSDMIDGFGDDATLSSSHNNDWYYFTGLSFSKTVYKEICARDK